MSDDLQTLLNRLDKECEKTKELFSSLTPGQRGQTIYRTSPEWTSRNILAHLVSAEREFLRLFQDICAGGGGAPEDFSPDEFNAREQVRMANISFQDLLVEFLKLRGETVNWVTGLSAEDLLKQGNHPVLGTICLADMISSLTLHAHLHCRDIRRVLEIA